MRVYQMPKQVGSYEVRTDKDTVLGWIDVERLPDPETGTLGRAFIAKPIEGPVRARKSLDEAAAWVAGCFN